MLATVQGVYRNGKIELLEIPADIGEETPVIVTFLIAYDVNLRSRGISRKQAAELRERLASFAEDWDSPEMAIYDLMPPDIRDEPFIGMWHDRPEMSDSSAWVRGLRLGEWGLVNPGNNPEPDVDNK